jgi:hypothetical protein
MLGKMPLRMEITAAPHGIPKEKLQPRVLRVGNASGLRELQRDYAFYTPALIYMKIRLLGRDPLSQFIQEYGQEVLPFSIRFNKPIFHGLNLGRDTSWNYVLFGVERQHWEPFKSFMGTMAFVDRQLKLFARVRTKEIRLADPLFFERATILPEKLPVIDATVFCLDTNQGCAWINMRGDPLLDLPELTTTDKVFEDTAAFAKAVFDDTVNPYVAANSTQPPEVAPRGVDPLQPREATPIESLPREKQSSLQALVRQYHEQRGKK